MPEERRGPCRLRFVVGDASRPPGDEAAIIAHVVNDLGAWGRGFVLSLDALSPQVGHAYRRDVRSGALSLGRMQLVRVTHRPLLVANLCAMRGLRSPVNPVPLDLGALDSALSDLGDVARAQGLSVHMPRLGAGLAGSRWGEIQPLIEARLAGVAVTVYDLPGAAGGGTRSGGNGGAS